ncbi:unnamed protein product [Malus baccata var. baccata]
MELEASELLKSLTEGEANRYSVDWVGSNLTHQRTRRYATIGGWASAITTLALFSTESSRHHRRSKVSMGRPRLSAITPSPLTPTVHRPEIGVRITLMAGLFRCGGPKKKLLFESTVSGLETMNSTLAFMSCLSVLLASSAGLDSLRDLILSNNRIQ